MKTPNSPSPPTTVASSPDSKANCTFSGLVIVNHGINSVVELPNGSRIVCAARKKLGLPLCGDHVAYDQNSPDAGVITAIAPRRNLLARPLHRHKEKQLAANVDQMIIVMHPASVLGGSGAEPDPEIQLDRLTIDRYLVAAEASDIVPMVVASKIDLLTLEQLAVVNIELAAYRQIGYAGFAISARTRVGMEPFQAALAQKTNIIVGPSGVGKSSLVNCLVPDIEVTTQAVSALTGLGKHTTTATTLYHLPSNGGHLIDSPGVREFGLWHLTESEIGAGYREFQPYLGQCRFTDCRHRDEPECAIKAAVATNEIASWRYQNYLALMQQYASTAVGPGDKKPRR